MAKGNDKTILVYFDAVGDPKVEVDLDVRGRKHLHWRKEDPTQDFVFKNIDFDPSPPFKLKELDHDRVDVDYSLAVGVYRYTLTVQDGNGVYHTTTELGGSPAAGDKPVIRN